MVKLLKEAFAVVRPLRDSNINTFSGTFGSLFPLNKISRASLTFELLNYIVFHYFSESGFTHQTFTFGYEARINRSTIDGHLVPINALVKIVQKGIQYLELETNLSNDDTDMDEDFKLLEPMDLITKSVDELRRIIKEKKEKAQKKKLRGKGKANADHKREPTRRTEMEKQHKEKEREHDRERSDVMVLEGHTSEVFACAWSPEGSLLASGSGDATARIWTIGDGPFNSTIPNVLVLNHLDSQATEENKDVTSLDWNREGTLLATGSYDGQARIWKRSGELVSTLNKHKGPIMSLKWNKKGNYLLSGSIDTTAVIWNVKYGESKQQFGFHSGQLLDVAWQNNDAFSTSSAESMIYVCKVGENKPVKKFPGHQNEINSINWDPSGSLLASCSDDTTVKIWSMKQDVCLHDFREHSKASLTSELLDYIVFHYFSETGFTYSAFTFGYEPGINRSTMDGLLVPVGALIQFVQKDI
ncbi:WD40 repeat-containing protein HOS15-like [Solanum pennellii]|uniref:WD40 repeat-containing protein HOS15-like n=1 Tax=Solanum pennellii TaxID=28526 RepID=A0ABM1V1L8_SOLPN|nr:WD40 repeat-containing protein HOS15-like [Solanum pennellii]